MKNVRTSYPLTNYLVAKNAFQDREFTLIDVGCSGGINKCWRAFGASLRAYGIDPVIREIQQLKSAELNPKVTYWAGRLGLPEDHKVLQSRGSRGPFGNMTWQRLSAAWVQELLSKEEDTEQTKMAQNRWPETELAGRETRMSLDEFVLANEIDSVDFIKIDVDGEDLYVLFSGENMIDSHAVLGFKLEVNFFGTNCKTDNTFHNIDRFMRRHGFELFDLTIRRYSRRAFPAPFVTSFPAQTEWGAPFQGDAVYARDFVRDIERDRSTTVSTSDLLKLVAMFEFFALPDCAAEILVSFSEQLREEYDVTHLLDLLVPNVKTRRDSYERHMIEFSKDPTRFYPRRTVKELVWDRGIGRYVLAVRNRLRWRR